MKRRIGFKLSMFTYRNFSMSSAEIRFKNFPIKMYVCGPTVYDDAHIGHARTYICFDVIRRIMTDCLDKNVLFALGITDIDDKIIERVRQGGNNMELSKFTANFEARFFEDMDQLNIRRPDFVLRVSEHLQVIINYIKGIETNGFAYTNSDGVYFDVGKLGSQYGKLCNIPDKDEHSAEDTINRTKRSHRDFALWKFVKGNEPSWESPWGRGRPGWHIECSAMASNLFGSSLDIHGGGIDLRFPHHTNEVAQCEAHNGCEGWVDRWMHTGHLHIQGKKMSKSLKNFITIREYLKSDCSSSPAVDLRIFFLHHKYHSTLHFSEDRIIEASKYRQKIESFLSKIVLVEQMSQNQQMPLRRSSTQVLGSVESFPPPVEPSIEFVSLANDLNIAKHEIQCAFEDDFDTPTALRSLSRLMNASLQYCLVIIESPTKHSIEPLLKVKEYVASILRVLGLDQIGAETTEDRPQDGISEGLPSQIFVSSKDSASESLAVGALVDFRNGVRREITKALKAVKDIDNAAKGVDNPATRATVETQKSAVLAGAIKAVLGECDNVRDKVAPLLGVVIEDIGDISTFRKKSN